MGKDFVEAVIDLEIAQRRDDDAAELGQRFDLAPEIAERIVQTASSIDQAYAIAELMR